MQRFLVIFVLPIAAVLLFFSGSLPYTLIYDEATLREADFTGDEPVSAEVVTCEVENAQDLDLGDVLETSFRATLRNNTDRFVVVSAIGEVFDPDGRSRGMHSQMMILNPESVEATTFRSSLPFMKSGRYKCEMRYAIGRFKN